MKYIEALEAAVEAGHTYIRSNGDSKDWLALSNALIKVTETERPTLKGAEEVLRMAEINAAASGNPGYGYDTDARAVFDFLGLKEK